MITHKALIVVLVAWTLALSVFSIPAFYSFMGSRGYYGSVSAALYHLPDPDYFQEISCTRLFGQTFCRAR